MNSKKFALNGNDSSRYIYLDGWRGLSIVAVLIGHFYPLPFINIGRFGVEMFFVLSGRLMAEILFVKQVEIKTFFKRRVSRVWPALFVFVFIMWLAFHLAEGKMHVSLITAITCVTFTYNYLLSYVGGAPVLDHIWSLCVEEHVYLILGITAYFSRRYNFEPLKFLMCLAVFFMLNGVFETLILGLNYYQVYWRTDVRGASILIAVCSYLYMQKYTIKLHSWVPLLFFMLGFIFSANFFPDPIKYSLGSLCLGLAISSIHQSPSWFIKAISHPIITRIGLISFSLYLWQQPFYQSTDNTTNSTVKIVLLGATILLAIVSYCFIETPARKFLNARWSK